MSDTPGITNVGQMNVMLQTTLYPKKNTLHSDLLLPFIKK